MNDDDSKELNEHLGEMNSYLGRIADALDADDPIVTAIENHMSAVSDLEVNLDANLTNVVKGLAALEYVITNASKQ